MHELEDLEGTLIVRSTDWIRADRSGIRHLRLGGYNGAPTAELVFTSMGWIGRSWIMQPPRTAVFPRETSLEWAVHYLETAEALGSASPAWAPLEVRECAPADGLPALLPFHMPDQPRAWAKMFKGHSLVFTEVAGRSGSARFLIVLDGVLVTDRSGAALLFDDLFDAVDHAEEEID